VSPVFVILYSTFDGSRKVVTVKVAANITVRLLVIHLLYKITPPYITNIPTNTRWRHFLMRAVMRGCILR